MEKMKERQEMRAHQMYHVLLNTSVIYQSKIKETMSVLESEEEYLKLKEELLLIGEVYAEVCGLKIQRFGEIEDRESDNRGSH